MKIAVPEVTRPRRLDGTTLIGLFLGPALLGITLLIPMPLSQPQQHLLALILLTIVFWVFRVFPLAVTGILALALAVLLGVAPSRIVFGAFSSSTLFLLIGSFLITQAMIKYGLGHRVALTVLSIPGVAGSTYRVIVAFGALSALMSSVLDNGAVAAILLPIAMGLIQTFSQDIQPDGGATPEGSPLRFSTALMLMLAYGSTVGALLTPMGDAVNLVGWHFVRNEFGIRIPVGTWMVLAAPIVLVLFAVMCFLVLRINRPEVRRMPHAIDQVARSRKALGPMSRGEFNTAVVFGVAVLFWLLPSVVALVGGHDAAAYRYLVVRLPPAGVAIFAAAALFVLPMRRREGVTLNWRDTKQMDWSPILLVGSTLALGELMSITGLAQVMGQALAERTETWSATGIYFFSAMLAVMFSELSTNLVSISVLVPMVPPMAAAGGGIPLEAAMVATFAAIYGFMLPISTSANAIVYASRQIPFWRMAVTGFLVDLSGIVVVVVGLHVMLRLVGLT